MRLILAIRAFFAVLFGWPLPPRLLPLLELETLRNERLRLQTELESAGEARAALVAEGEEAGRAREALASERDAEARKATEARRRSEELRTRIDGLEEARRGLEAKLARAREDGALSTLAWLQREGRLIDFLNEAIDGYDDAQVGAAARAVHQGCRKVLSGGLELEPILEGEEGSRIEIPAGFDPVAIQLTGNVRGDPPFEGTLMHHGWRTRRVSVPVPETVDTRIIAPAEVEL